MKKEFDERKKKDLNYYMGLDYPITLDFDEEDGKKIYIAEIPDLPGCSAYGESRDEAFAELEDAKKAWIGTSLKRNLPIQEPVQQDLYSGKFLLRIPAKLHMNLAKEAEKENVSLNQYVRQILEQKGMIQVLYKKIDELCKEMKDIKDDLKGLKGEGLGVQPWEELQRGLVAFLYNSTATPIHGQKFEWGEEITLVIDQMREEVA